MNPKPTRRWMRPAIAAVAVGAAITVPLLTFGSTTAQASDGRLEPFQTCDDFVALARQRALDMLATGGGYVMPMAREGLTDTLASGAKQLHNTSAPASDTHSTTNVQEVGIDEPDVVKTDGRRTFAVAGGKVYAIDTSGSTAKLMGSVTLPAGAMAQEMLLSGNRLLVIAGSVGMIEPGIGGPEGTFAPEIGRIANLGTTFVDIDVSDLAKPTVRESLTVDGSFASARMTGSTVRIVMNSDPLVSIGMNATSEDQYRSAIAGADADDFIPSATFTDAAGATTTGPLVACANISHPTRATPFGMLSIMTMDLSAGIRPVDSDAVMAQGATVMASQNRVYVALSRNDVEDNTMVMKTDIHAFDAATPGQTDYVATGTVLGSLLNQFSMSEYDGRLRVATTLESYPVAVAEQSEPPAVVTGSDSGTVDPVKEPTSADGSTGDGSPAQDTAGADTPVASDDSAPSGATSVAIAPASESAVSILELDGDKLTQVGRVAGLGKGERIYAVRFIGPTGYVVTFRQTDPLYTVDLSNPTRPRVVGELKIPGYSSYLHPVDDHTLIGVGQMVGDGTAKGARANGLQVALFDVSDPAAPKRTQLWTLPGAYSDAEYDAHAFLWWPKSGTVVLPTNGAVTTAAPDVIGSTYRPSAIALKLTPDAITKTATILHPASDQTAIRRSVVVGDNLYTFSDAGFKVSSLNGAESRQWVAFG